MSLAIRQSTKFRWDVKRFLRQGVELSKLETIITVLSARKAPDERLRDHALVGNWRGFRECHIEPDWLPVLRLCERVKRSGCHPFASISKRVLRYYSPIRLLGNGMIMRPIARNSISSLTSRLCILLYGQALHSCIPRR